MAQFTIPQNAEIAINIANEAEQNIQNLIRSTTENLLFEAGVDLLGPVNPDVTFGSIFPVTFFGQPFIGDITLCPEINGKKQTFIDVNNLKNGPITLEPVNISTCLITVNNEKNIVKTPIIGRNGTIKTYMNNSDYDITIEAILFAPDDPDFLGDNYNGVYPYNLVNKLIAICEAPCFISISSDYLNQFYIYNIAIEEYDISQEEGKYSQQKVTIKAVSDSADVYNTMLNY